MAEGESENQTIAKDYQSSDVVQSFIEENILDEKQVDTYKGYKKYGAWADRWYPLIWVIVIGATIGLALIEYTVFGPESEILFRYAIGPLTIALVAPMLIIVGSAIARKVSDITSEQVAYHELASAFQLYRQDSDNIDRVLERLSTSTNYITPRRIRRISSKEIYDIMRYLKKVDDVDNKTYISEEFHQTFPTFMQELSSSITPSSETMFSKLAKDMDSAYTGETSMRDRISEDITRVFQFLFTGAESFVIVSLLVLTTAVYYANLEIATAVGIFGILFAIYTHYQNSD